MSELDEFLRWVGQQRGRDWGYFGYGTLGGAIDIFRAERISGRSFTRWVDAYESLHEPHGVATRATPSTPQGEPASDTEERV